MARTIRTERDDLDEKLRACFSESPHVYYNPPEKLKMTYPAILYFHTGGRNFHANNIVHAQTHGYKITVVDRDPESPLAKQVSKIPGVAQGPNYRADNLYHFTFTINLFIKEVHV